MIGGGRLVARVHCPCRRRPLLQPLEGDTIPIVSAGRRGAVFVNLSLSDDKPHPTLVSSRRHRRLLSDYTGKGRGGDVDRERKR